MALVVALAACGQGTKVSPEVEPQVVEPVTPMTVFPPVAAGESWCADRGYAVVDGTDVGRTFVCVDDGLAGG